MDKNSLTKLEIRKRQLFIQTITLIVIGLILIIFAVLSLRADENKLFVYIPLILGVLIIISSFSINIISNQDLYIETAIFYQSMLLADNSIQVSSKSRQDIRKHSLEDSIKKLEIFNFEKARVFTAEEIKHSSNYINKYLLETIRYNQDDFIDSFKGYLISFKISNLKNINLMASTYKSSLNNMTSIPFDDFYITYNKNLYEEEDISKDDIKLITSFYKKLYNLFYMVINKNMNNGVKIENGLVTIFISYDYNIHGIRRLDNKKGYSLYKEIVLAIINTYDLSKKMK